MEISHGEKVVADMRELVLMENKEVKKLTRFNKFFSNVSALSVADSTPIETQLALVNALKEVE
jgi:hypothetical protein